MIEEYTEYDREILKLYRNFYLIKESIEDSAKCNSIHRDIAPSINYIYGICRASLPNDIEFSNKNDIFKIFTKE